MCPPHPFGRHVVLLGAGHAHLEVLRRFAARPPDGVRLTLIGREPETPYSAMLPGLLRGDYGHAQAHVALPALAASAGARLIVGEAVAIDPAARFVAMGEQKDVSFDILSVNVGGSPAAPRNAGVPVRPIGRFLARFHDLRQALPPHSRLAIVGAGAAGTELALALAVRFGERFRLTLVSDAAEPIAGAPKAARRIARKALASAGVEWIGGVAATTFRDNRLALSDGRTIDAATALWVTAVEGPAFLRASGIACDAAGCIRVAATLNSISHPHVFAAGDCASLDHAPRPKGGVWAVRAGRPLAENLRRAAAGHRLKPWRPQREALTILGLGHGQAVAWRNGLTLHGALAWRLKDRIDRRWMRLHGAAAAKAPRQRGPG